MSLQGHIVIACSYLHVPGGYEKAMISTANLFAVKGHQVTLLVLDHTAETFYPLHPKIKLVHLPVNFGITSKGNKLSRKWKLWTDTRKLKKTLRSLAADILICTEYHFAAAAIMSGAKKQSRVYSWEHHHFGAQELNRFWNYLREKTYKELDAVVCLNTDEQRHYLSLNKQATVIPNFIDPPLPVSIVPAHIDKNFDLISVTRFNHIKGIDLLMKTASSICKTNPKLKWKVIGYGTQKDQFLNFIKEHQLEKNMIYQPADQVDISNEYRSARVFVMTSRNECFPLVLLEAMREGLPCIAFDCETGPRHIIRHTQTGYLVQKENTDALCQAISDLLENPAQQKEMGDAGRTIVREYYPDRVYELWKKLFDLN